MLQIPVVMKKLIAKIGLMSASAKLCQNTCYRVAGVHAINVGVQEMLLVYYLH